MTVGTVLFALLAPPQGMPVLVWNASASAPLGLYLVGQVQGIQRGDLVVARLPEKAAKLAARRAYLPLGVPAVKYVAALSGDRVCSIGDAITINERTVARRLAADKEGRSLPVWQGCVRLNGNHVFLLTASVPDSFDGRYFGPVRRNAVIGKAIPLWTW